MKINVETIKSINIIRKLYKFQTLFELEEYRNKYANL